jgi:hypothetical protein
MAPSPTSMVLAWHTSGGMLFQVMIIRGKKEKRYTSARVYIILNAAIPLVLQSDGMSRCSARIWTKLCMTLYISSLLLQALGYTVLCYFKHLVILTFVTSSTWLYCPLLLQALGYTVLCYFKHLLILSFVTSNTWLYRPLFLQALGYTVLCYFKHLVILTFVTSSTWL